MMGKYSKFTARILIIWTFMLSAIVYNAYLLDSQFFTRTAEEKFLLLELINLIQTTDNLNLYLEICNVPLDNYDLLLAQRLEFYYFFDAETANLLIRYCKYINSIVPRVVDVTPSISVDSTFVEDWQLSVVLGQIDVLFECFFFY